MKSPGVLVGCPIHMGARYCFREFINRMKELEYDHYNILLVENSEDGEFFEELKKEGEIVLIKDLQKGKRGIEKVVSSRNKIIDYALENNYDYVLMMDSDVIPPKNIIKELLKSEKDIISGLYYNYFVSSGKMKMLPVAWKHLTEKEFEEIKDKMKLSDYVKSNQDLRRHLTQEEIAKKEIIEVFLPSAGCMLISRKVFENVRYGLLEMPAGSNLQTGDDIYFIEEARKRGFRAFCNTGIICDHLISGKFSKNTDGKFKNPLY